MAGNTGDVLQLTLEASYGGQVLNVFYYRCQDLPTDGYLTGLTTEFKSVVLPQIRNCTNPGYVLTKITVINIFNQDDYLVDVSVAGLAGQRTGTDQISSLIAAGIYLQPNNRRVRRGYKFIPAAFETDLNGNVWTDNYLAALQNLAGAIASNLTAGLADVFAPIIIRRIREGNGYRLPTSQAEMGNNFAYIAGAIPRNLVTTMRSRKAGRGS
jgi:hypothetical protein